MVWGPELAHSTCCQPCRLWYFSMLNTEADSGLGVQSMQTLLTVCFEMRASKPSQAATNGNGGSMGCDGIDVDRIAILLLVWSGWHES